VEETTLGGIMRMKRQVRRNRGSQYARKQNTCSTSGAKIDIKA
jgi:hypothetical protein